MQKKKEWKVAMIIAEKGRMLESWKFQNTDFGIRETQIPTSSHRVMAFYDLQKEMAK